LNQENRPTYPIPLAWIILAVIALLLWVFGLPAALWIAGAGIVVAGVALIAELARLVSKPDTDS
jgi:uncharacterized membrane protein